MILPDGSRDISAKNVRLVWYAMNEKYQENKHKAMGVGDILNYIEKKADSNKAFENFSKDITQKSARTKIERALRVLRKNEDNEFFESFVTNRGRGKFWITEHLHNNIDFLKENIKNQNDRITNIKKDLEGNEYEFNVREEKYIEIILSLEEKNHYTELYYENILEELEREKQMVKLKKEWFPKGSL
ncbi:MAG: hypothetical protein ACTSW1_05800 [Candidatus Hodarchaeales archaeon]